jgi:tetratricopeptide (TPR) repeat protein
MTEQSVASLEPRLQKLVESARTAFERGNFDYAIELARDVLTAAPGCLPVRRLLRAAQLKRGGGGLFSKALGSVSTAPFLVSGYAVLAKDPAKALARAQKMLEADPNSAAGLRLLGGAASALGWHETAVFAFEALRENAPDDWENLIALGRAHLGAGRADAAVRCAEAVLARDSINGGAQALLKDASVAQTIRVGRWEEGGDFRGKVKQT